MINVWNKVKNFIIISSGSLDAMVWVIGSAVVVAAVIYLINTSLMPGTVTNFWSGLTNYVNTKLGL